MLENNEVKNIDQASRDAAAMSYVWIMSIFILIFKREDEFVQYHARQSAILFVLSLFIWMIPMIGNFLEIIVVAGMIFGFIQASQGVRYAFPVISDLVSGKVDWKGLQKKVMKQAGLKESRKKKIEEDLKMNPDDLKEDPEEKERRRRELAEEVSSPVRPEDI